MVLEPRAASIRARLLLEAVESLEASTQNSARPESEAETFGVEEINYGIEDGPSEDETDEDTEYGPSRSQPSNLAGGSSGSNGEVARRIQLRGLSPEFH